MDDRGGSDRPRWGDRPRRSDRPRWGDRPGRGDRPRRGRPAAARTTDRGMDDRGGVTGRGGAIARGVGDRSRLGWAAAVWVDGRGGVTGGRVGGRWRCGWLVAASAARWGRGRSTGRVGGVRVIGCSVGDRSRHRWTGTGG
ncbi:hypothetical protein F8566_48745 [Actinomadura rudentiformis]|uniref:Uncharacterized protein n=1 Tax=Actinomadura rudentiformis TaxID=359158 RepID=A0A6H9YFX3_9ACTN|nr:hypothetical protein F8566_48745 [Actinomadura rudentiformis]